MVAALSFSRPYLYIQPPPQSPPKVHFSYLQLSSVNLPHFSYFHLPIPLLLVHKIILTISTNTPFLYTTAIFHLLIFMYSPTIQIKIIFPTSTIYIADSGCQGVRESCEDWHFFDLSPLPQSIGRDSRAHNHWFLIASSLWWRFLQSEWKTIQFTFSLILNLFSLIPYPIKPS